jgi:periplasmic divalent cation tolerance protein
VAGAADAPAAPGAVEVAFVTAPDAETAAGIARALVEERLAACVNLVPGVRSIYRWEGRVEEASETLLIVKTRAERAHDLEARVRALHPYDLPEVLRVAAAGGSAAYLAWVLRETAP